MPRRPAPRGTSGGALVFVLLTVLMVAALAASFLRLNSGIARRQAGAVDQKEAFYVAEAGLAESFAGLTIGKTGNVGTPDQPAYFGEAVFWVEATEVPGGLVELESTALAGSARAQLSAVVRPGEVSVASLGIFAAGDVVVDPGTLIDGYNSRETSYEELDPEDLETFAGGRLGANGSIALGGTSAEPTVVRGDVTAGPEQAIATEGEVTIQGQTSNAFVTTPLPAVRPPSIALGAALRHDDPLPLVVPPGEKGLASLTVGPQAEVHVVGPIVLRVGSLNVEPSGKLLLDNTAGEIRLYVDEGLSLQQGSILEVATSDPSRLSVQVAGESAEPLPLLAEGVFHGVLYAPASDLELGGGLEVFGALIGRDLHLVGPTRLHFDEMLLDSSASDSLPTIVSWRVLELGRMPGAEPGSSPFTLLGLDPDLLPRPVEAHRDQYLRIAYLTTGATFASWEGMESAFDWSQVGTALVVERDGASVPSFEEPRTVASALIAGDPTVQALIDALADPSLGSSQLRDLLVAEAPLCDTVLDAALRRSPAMGSSDLRDVLASSPLTDGTLITMLVDSPMQSSDVDTILDASSPLSNAVLLQAVDSSDKLDSSLLRDLLLLNSPLSLSVLLQLPLRIPAMNPLDLLAVQAAQ